jgi:hypothetical protein
VLGVFRIGVVIRRQVRRRPRAPTDSAFTAVGAASGLASALLVSVGPLTAPFFLAASLTRAAYIGTEAASALTRHLAKIVTYGAGDLLTGQVLVYGAALTPPPSSAPSSIVGIPKSTLGTTAILEMWFSDRTRSGLTAAARVSVIRSICCWCSRMGSASACCSPADDHRPRRGSSAVDLGHYAVDLRVRQHPRCHIEPDPRRGEV